MKDQFNVLNASELEKLKETVALITVYIAGADGEIDVKETEWAEKVTKIRAYNEEDVLASFYSEVGKDFHEKLDQFVHDFPVHPHTRNPLLEARIAEVNPILAKLDPELGAEVYKSFVSFAKHVAKASGGFFGFFSIGPKEAELLELKMLDPITA